jgi:hypothetical protein
VKTEDRKSVTDIERYRKQCVCEGIGCDICRPDEYEFCGPMMPDGSHEHTED